MGEVSPQNLTQTRADFVSSDRPFAPRALLQIFIKTTPHHRLRAFVAFSFPRRYSHYFYFSLRSVSFKAISKYGGSSYKI
jgi:hypothetical protein